MDSSFPFQTGDHSCGVWVVYVAYAMACSKPKFVDGIKQARLRRRMFHIMSEDCNFPGVKMTKVEKGKAGKKREDWKAAGANRNDHAEMRKVITDIFVDNLVPTPNGRITNEKKGFSYCGRAPIDVDDEPSPPNETPPDDKSMTDTSHNSKRKRGSRGKRKSKNQN